VIKHAHHTFDIDHPGKDSYRLRESGAVQMLLGSSNRWALMTERSRTEQGAQEIRLEELLAQLDVRLADLILVEGFKQEAFPKIEVYRPSLGTPLIAAEDSNIIAIATDGEADSPLPRLNLNDIPAIADFVIAWLKQQQNILKPASTR
jgi:molybdopterin-guanine dinucleotide biosynthesis protein B